MALIPGLPVRPTQGRIIGGVCAGIARRLDMDPMIVRLVTLGAIFIGGVSIWIYPVAWALMPDQGADKAPIEDLFKQANEWNSSRKLSQPAPPQPTNTDMPTFNPYEEPRS